MVFFFIPGGWWKYSCYPRGCCGATASEETTRKAKRKQESDWSNWGNGERKGLTLIYRGEKHCQRDKQGCFS